MAINGLMLHSGSVARNIFFFSEGQVPIETYTIWPTFEIIMVPSFFGEQFFFVEVFSLGI